MTAVPGDGRGVVTVICDACGGVEETADVLRDEDVVWPSLTLLGWTGSPFAMGMHRCPGCAQSVRAERFPAAAPAPDEAADAACDIRDVAEPRARIVLLRADLDQHLVDRIRPALVEAAAAGRHVVVDMRHAGVIDSAGLGLLVRAYRAAKHRGATVCLVAPSRFVLTVLHTMHLDDVFPTYPDTRTAMRHLAPPAVTAC
ncbi:STAS domain-containing protein [Couchioplanes caeruleus]|uniref:Anti-sigma factor antagonist n=2 Tax=Couchioplanes caeruleus TaxID=56438 RepID=A0A1K0GS22_9ACTN|nr:STAS domain-containing protein [Couchioplanes caeruleus]OJF15238.1 hypothetical protein BG844_05575 [Couchioplanes caeruleus subsp. caeruleus]ROP28398.1 anti-anti-sigma factor [Couchioplanes caeruleus]